MEHFCRYYTASALGMLWKCIRALSRITKWLKVVHVITATTIGFRSSKSKVTIIYLQLHVTILGSATENVNFVSSKMSKSNH